MSARRLLILAGRFAVALYVPLAALAIIGPGSLWASVTANLADELLVLAVFAFGAGVCLAGLIAGPELWREPAADGGEEEHGSEPVVVLLPPQPGRNGGVRDRGKR